MSTVLGWDPWPLRSGCAQTLPSFFPAAAELGICDLCIQLAMEQFGSGHQPLR